MKIMKRYKEEFNSNFWDWFEDSKVVDKQGNPLIVYHGSGRDVTEITPGYNEPGAYFTTNYKLAGNYAKGNSEVIYSVYLKIEKPFIVNFNDNMEPIVNGKIVNFEDNIEIVNYVYRKNYDGIWFPEGNFTESDETWVAFYPNQIKSVDNRGTWDYYESNMFY